MAQAAAKRMMMIKRIFAAAIVLCACSQADAPAQTQTQATATPAGAVQQWRLPDRLREISGLAVSPDGRLFGHDDERAVIYEIDPRQGRVIKAFALGNPVERGDFEGIAIRPNGEFWVTTSQGVLYRFREAEDGATAAFDTFDTGLSAVCEIEGLAYLAAEESLILACKRNQARGMRDTVSLHIWRFAGAAEPWLSIPEATLAEAAGVERFRPSSADIQDGRLLLLSASDGALAELSMDGRILSARALSAAHVQAEAVVTLPDGSVAIADERGDSPAALLTIYPGVGQ